MGRKRLIHDPIQLVFRIAKTDRDALAVAAKKEGVSMAGMTRHILESVDVDSLKISDGARSGVKTARIGLILPVELRDKLEVAAKKRDVSVSWVVRAAIRRWLESEEPDAVCGN
jgi:hypothetical protein